MKKVLIYCRESRDDGFENYERIETQRDILIDFCEKQNLGTVVDIIMDDNQSGTNFERLRPVRAKIERKEVDILLCKDASRLGRNILESLNFTAFLDDHQVELVFESERYDEDLFPLVAWFNERRVKDDSVKIRRVLRHKMQEGSMVIKAPYGYVKDGNRLAVDKSAAPVIREVFDLYLSGENMGQIACIMNEKGYSTPSQLKYQYKNLNPSPVWNRQHIARILKHRIYTGDMPYGMREKVSYKSKKYINKPKADWIVVTDHHEAIISKEDFERVQVKMTRSLQTKPRKSGDKTFSGLLFCARCGSRMLKIERAALRTSYVCGKSHREGRAGCSPHRVFADDLINAVKNYIEKMLTDEVFKERLCQELERFPSADYERSTQMQSCEKTVSELQKKVSILYDDRLNGIIPAHLFTQKLEAINTELAVCENKRHAALRVQPEVKNTLASVIAEIHKNGIHHDTVSLLFNKILCFDPEDIKEEQRQEYDLSYAVYERLKNDGGILFVQNYEYPISNHTHRDN